MVRLLVLIGFKYLYRGVVNFWVEIRYIYIRYGKCMRRKRLIDKKLIKIVLIVR